MKQKTKAKELRKFRRNKKCSILIDTKTNQLTIQYRFHKKEIYSISDITALKIEKRTHIARITSGIIQRNQRVFFIQKTLCQTDVPRSFFLQS